MNKTVILGLVALWAVGCATTSPKPSTAKKSSPPAVKTGTTASKKTVTTAKPTAVAQRSTTATVEEMKPASPPKPAVVEKEITTPKKETVVAKKTTTTPQKQPVVAKQPTAAPKKEQVLVKKETSAPKKEVAGAKKPATAPAPRVALPARKLTTDDIITLTRNGATDQQIIQHIDRTRSVFQLKMADLESLRAAGVSDPVITHMLDTYTRALLREKPAPLPAEVGGGTYDYGYQYPFGVLYDAPERRW